MTLTDMRVIVTVVSFVCFIGIVLWTFSRRRNQSFDEAAMLPFLDDEQTGSNERSVSQHGAQQ